MGRKKMLVAEGFFDEDYVAPEDQWADVKQEVVRLDDDEFFCQFCDQGYETEKGLSIHEKRWCKEKPVEEEEDVIADALEEMQEEAEEKFEELFEEE